MCTGYCMQGKPGAALPGSCTGLQGLPAEGLQGVHEALAGVKDYGWDMVSK